MITIYINGQAEHFEQPVTLCEALQRSGYHSSAFALAVDGVFVPKAGYDSMIYPDARLDVLLPMAGG